MTWPFLSGQETRVYTKEGFLGRSIPHVAVRRVVGTFWTFSGGLEDGIEPPFLGSGDMAGGSDKRRRI